MSKTKRELLIVLGLLGVLLALLVPRLLQTSGRGSSTQVIIDDRALDERAIEMLAAILVGRDGDARTSPARGDPRAKAQGA